MRTGWNPYKAQRESEPAAETTVGVLNCLPDLSGYFEQGLEVLKLCLASIRHHADRDFDLLVVDNGSCEPVRAFLQEELAAGRIDYLLLNHRNVGEGNGVMQILRAAPGQQIFYSDGDIYYEPGWMSAHLAVHQKFPNAGLVGGRPVRGTKDAHTSATFRWLAEHGEIKQEVGQLIDPEWTAEFARSVGLTTATPGGEQRWAQWQRDEDCRVSLDGVSAYVGASHMQFLMPRTALDRLPQTWSTKTWAKAKLVDAPLDEAGLLRLSTARPYAHHIGNAISEPRFQSELERLTESAVARSDPTARHKRQAWVWRQPPVRKALRKLYSWAFAKYTVDS